MNNKSLLQLLLPVKLAGDQFRSDLENQEWWVKKD